MVLPLPTSFDFVHKERVSKSKFIQDFHEKVKHQIQAHVEKIAHSKNKGKKVWSFNEGDLVWLHLRKERFPNIRKSIIMLINWIFLRNMVCILLSTLLIWFLL